MIEQFGDESWRRWPQLNVLLPACGLDPIPRTHFERQMRPSAHHCAHQPGDAVRFPEDFSDVPR
jgi:hypothetical protein